MFASLRSRLVLSNLLITLLGLMILVAVYTNLLASRSTSLKEQFRQQQAHSVAAQVDSLFQQHASVAQLDRLVTLSSRLLDARVVIVSPTQLHIVDSARHTPFYTGTYVHLDRSALAHGKTVAEEINRDQSIYRFQAPITGVHGPNGGAVLLIVKVTQVQPGGGFLVAFAFVSLGVALVIWFLIGLYLTTSISRPLLALVDATERMAAGEYSARVRVRGHSEIGRLGTQFNTMAERVQRSNQTLRDFVANVSHDLRTPITIVVGFAEAIMDGTAADSSGAAEIIYEEAGKMGRLVDNLLHLTRLESGLMPLERRPIHARDFVQTVLDRMPLTGPRLENAVPDDITIDADVIQIERAVRNLLDNAMQHTGSDGIVRVSGSRDGDWASLTVEDSGAGIPSDELPRIFERFYRADKSRKGRGHSGLGLAIVREIAEAHGGLVEIESVLGRGTHVRLVLPVATGAVRQQEVAP